MEHSVDNDNDDAVENNVGRRNSSASIEHLPVEEYLLKQMELSQTTTITPRDAMTAESVEQCRPKAERVSFCGKSTIATTTTTEESKSPEVSMLHPRAVDDHDVESGKPKEQAHQGGLPSSVTRKRHHSETASLGLDRSRQHDVSLPGESLPRVGAFRVSGVNRQRRLEESQSMSGRSFSTELDTYDDEYNNNNNNNNNSNTFSARANQAGAVFVDDAQMIVVAEPQQGNDGNQSQSRYSPEESEAHTCITTKSGRSNQGSKNRNPYCYWGLGIVVALLVVIGSVVGIVILGRPDSTPASAGSKIQTTPSPSLLLTRTPSASPSVNPTELLTIAAYLYRPDNEPRNFLGITIAAEPLGIIAILNETDRNFTVFAPPEEVMLLLTQEFLAKFASEAWYGHIRSLLRQHILPFALYTTDLGVNEQRTVQTIDSINSPSVVTRNTFRGVPLYNDAKDIRLVNGVVHAISQILLPTWFNKSLVEIVQQVNEELGGDLSVFLQLLNATSPSNVWLVALESYEGGPQTLVVPTNEAWLRLFPLSAIERMASTGTNESVADLGSLMQNHVLVGVNVVCSAWTETTLEFRISSNEASVTTLSGNKVRIVREMSGAVLNGVSRIVVEDQFSDYGVVQVVDGVLVPPGFNASLV